MGRDNFQRKAWRDRADSRDDRKKRKADKFWREKRRADKYADRWR